MDIKALKRGGVLLSIIYIYLNCFVVLVVIIYFFVNSCCGGGGGGVGLTFRPL